MKYSIIVPVYNDDHIQTCLQSLENLEYPREEYEIIVVDNNSDSWVKEIIDQSSAIYVHESKKGSYAARNAGTHVAQGEVLAFTDSDCLADPHWLRAMDAVFNDMEIDAVMGYARGKNHNKIAEYEQRMYEQVINDFVQNDRLRRIDTRNFAIRAMAFAKVGLFTDDLLFGGDMEYGARAHQAGCAIVFNKSISVSHINPTDLTALLHKRVRQNYGNMKIRELHDKAFVEEYFPHLYRYTPSPLLKARWYVLWLIKTLEFSQANFICKLAPGIVGYLYFKIINIRAMQLGQISYVLGKEV